MAVFVHGFQPYFYVEAPTPTFSPDDCQALADHFNVRFVCVCARVNVWACVG